MSRFVYAVFISLVVFSAALNRNEPCTTPNNEKAKCIPVKSCDVILEGVITRNQAAVSFAKKSLCGYDGGPLVCCGTTAYPQEFNIDHLFATAITDSAVTTAMFTPAPVTPKPTSKRTTLKPSSTPTTPRSSFLPDRTVCGFQSLADRIVGGMATAIDEFPWMVLLKYKDTLTDEVKFKCGGTLINNRYVLTAAHCVSGPATRDSALVGVRLGEWDYSKNDDCVPGQIVRECADPVEDRLVQEIIPHAFYSNKRSIHDIALLRLDSPVHYTSYIRPICLPPMDMPTPKAGTYMTVAGWGVTDTAETVSPVKLKVSVPIRPNEDCKKTFEKKSISANQVCAGGEHERDSCRGDSGGPLMHYYADTADEERQWYQEGIVSFGTYVCGIEMKPAVYTRTARYLNWILSNIRD